MAKLAKGRLCVVHNNIVEASVKLEVSEQRVIAYLTSLIGPKDSDFTTYTIEVKEFAALLNLNRNDFYKEIKDTTKNLMKKVMSLKPLDGRPGELQIAWLSKARYYDGLGLVELRFDPDLKPYLLQLKERFTKYPLEDVIRFKSQFSMPFYLLLKQYISIGYRQFTIEELRHKLSLGEQYTQYGHFKARILNTVTKEINEKTGLTIAFEEIREGRRVKAVRFTIKSKPTRPQDINMFNEPESPAPEVDLQIKIAIEEIQQAKEITTAVIEEEKKYPCPTCGQGCLVKRINGQNKQFFWGCSRYRKGSADSCNYSQDIDPAADEINKKLKAEKLAEQARLLLEKETIDHDVQEPFLKEFKERIKKTTID